MKVLTSLLTVVALPLLVVAHDGDNLEARLHYARQTPSSASSHSGSTSASSTSGTILSKTVNGSVTASTSSTPSIVITLLSTNPTAVPLASIVSNEPSGPTQALTTSEAAGAVPSDIPNAPPLPNLANFNPRANYPPLDLVPPTDSPEVKQWIQDVSNTGIQIPNLSPSIPGGCPANINITSDPDRCWWSCTHCTVPFDITECPTPMTWGLTYDDGPAFYTSQLLSYLDANSLKATFFVVGSRCAEFPETLQVEYMGGHQIAVHTWSHPYLTTLTNEQIIAELGWTKKVIQELLGVTPNYMRPPYGDIDNRVRAISVAMGLTPVLWTVGSSNTTAFDTGDFNIEGGTITAPQVIQNWEYIMGNVSTLKTGFIVLEHDLFQQTVQLATGYILPDALATVPKFNITPVVNCLNLPMSDAYIETNNNASNTPVISGSYVTVISPSPTAGSKSSSDARFSVGFSLMFIMTIVTLLAGVYAVRF